MFATVVGAVATVVFFTVYGVASAGEDVVRAVRGRRRSR
jgi:hypothetical protein